jgi:hypothetical protein
MGQRERKRRKTSVTAPGYERGRARTGVADPAPDREPSAGYARGRARADAVRASLPPLEPGERPTAVTVGAVVAALLAIAVVIGAATSEDLAKKGGSFGGAAVIAGLLVLAAYGMWRARYWAVLGFEAFLGFQILTTALALVVVSKWWAAVLCVLVIGLSGWLFWKLIRAMARLQMPERRRVGS